MLVSTLSSFAARTRRSAGAWQAVATLFLLLLAGPSLILAQSIQVTSSPSSITIHPGLSQTISVTVTGTSPTPVSVSVTGLPSNVTASPAPLILSAGGTGTITLSAATNADFESFSAYAPDSPITHSGSGSLKAVSGGISASSNLSYVTSLSNPGFAPASSAINLPVLRIDTGGVAVTSGDVNVPGTVTLTAADGMTTLVPGAANSNNAITIHLHGNTTAEMPKKPYTLKFGSSFDLMTALGVSCPYVTSSGKPICDKAKSYILLANYDDKTMLRDWAASALANSIPMGNGYLSSPAGSPTPSGTTALLPWAPHSTYVELYLNGQYGGTYQIIEKIDIDSHKVNVPELAETDTTLPTISGGYLMEIDHHADESFVFDTPQGLPIGGINPDFSPDPNVQQQSDYIRNAVDTAENALFSTNFTDPTTGWRAFYDETAAVNFYLVNDLMGNVDGGDFFSSVYFYKDRNNQLLYMGPVWDFDISAGNVNYFPIVNPTVPWMQTQAIWYAQLFKDPGFAADTAKQFNQLKNGGVLTAWTNSIRAEAASLNQAQQNNFARWPMLGELVWPNAQAPGTYSGEVNLLLNYINTRIAYLDGVLNHKAPSAVTLVTAPASVVSGSTLTLSAKVSSASGGGVPTGSVAFNTERGLLGVASVDGSGMATYAGPAPAAGNVTVTATYTGDSAYAISASGNSNLSIAPAAMPVTLALTANATTYASGSNAKLIATLYSETGNATPSGSVVFSLNGITLATSSVNSGQAVFETTALPAGADTIVATYAGTASFLPASGQVAVTVNGAAAAATPALSPAGGTFSSAQSVVLSDSTPGAVIHYTTNGSLPTVSSPVYSGPISVSVGTVTIQALATASGYATSSISAATYTIQASMPMAMAPTFTPAPGSYNTGQTVTLADATAGAVVYYTTNGTAPTASSAMYSAPIALSNGTTTVKAIAMASGYAPSAVASGTYVASTPSAGATAIPTLTPVPGSYSSGQVVTLADSTPQSVIHVTTDGSAPTVNSPVYSAGITLAPGTTTVKAVAIASGYTVSAAVSGTYTVAGTPPSTPSISNPNGFSAASNLRFNGSGQLAGNLIQLLDGRNNQASSVWYGAPVPVSSFTTSFNFQMLNPSGDGLTLTFQNTGVTALGGSGNGLGYGVNGTTPGIAKSVALKFAIFNETTMSSVNAVGLYQNGVTPLNPSTDITSSGVSLRSGNTFNAMVSYDGTTLTLVLTDLSTKKTVTYKAAVNLPGIVGSSTAYAGFTAASGSHSSLVRVLNWTLTTP